MYLSCCVSFWELCLKFGRGFLSLHVMARGMNEAK